MKSIKTTIELLVLIVNAMEAYSAIDNFIKRSRGRQNQQGNYYQQSRNY